MIEDMQVAVELIQNALEKGDKITVFGDYDCDGVTATIILFTYLEAIGADVNWYIPSREEGYGLNIPALERLIKNGTKMVITVDNGISAVNEAMYLKENGVSLIITDHHRVPELLPEADAVINPHRFDDNSPFKELSGAGVALKLVTALEGDSDTILEQYSEFAAIGTIADIVPLVGENREIVTNGLMYLKNTENLGLISLLKISGVDEEKISAQTLAFTICPRINAAGRFDHASRAVELFLSSNPETASSRAEALNTLNIRRRESEAEIMKQVEAQIAKNPDILNQRVIILDGSNWHHGVIGIVSARILERYSKPNLIISFDGDMGKASARSINGFSLFKLLEGCSDLLVKFGGHTKAAGFSIERKNLDEFKNRVASYCQSHYPVMPVQSLICDLTVSAGDLTVENIEKLSLLEPFGESNSEPLFIIKGCRIEAKKSLKDGKYISFDFSNGSVKMKALCFYIDYKNFPYKENDCVDIVGTPQISEFKGTTSIIIKVKDLRPNNFDEDRYFAAKNVYEKIILGEDFDPRLIKRIIPQREDVMKIFDILKANNGLMLDSLETIALMNGINNCMFRIAIDSLREIGIVTLDTINGQTFINKDVKAKLSSSKLLSRLTSMSESV